MTLTEAARAAVVTHRRVCEAEAAQRGCVLDKDSDYKGAYAEYVRRRQEHADAMGALKAALSADDVRRAAEAGSPQARMLEANVRL